MVTPGQRSRPGSGLSGDRVRLLGPVAEPDLPPLYAACDLYVWPAVAEAYGMAMLEAQAAGLPVLAGREGGVADIVDDGDHGPARATTRPRGVRCCPR